MISKKIFIDYKELNVLAAAYEVVLSNLDNTFGVKEVGSHIVLIPSGTTLDNPSIGRYEKIIELEENTAYIVSWKITPNFGDQPKFASQIIGPFTTDSQVNTSSDFRGSFIQGTRATLFLKITDLAGNPQDATSVLCAITKDGNQITSGFPEKVHTGFYAFDFNIAEFQELGKYDVLWTFNSDTPHSEAQTFIVASRTQSDGAPSLYTSRISDFRNSLGFMITCAQSIPVYSEPAKASADKKTYMFSFKRWNQSPGCRVYLNDEIVTSGIKINYFTGTAVFDDALSSFDRVKVDYNFRWFSDEELDRFLSNALNLVNLYPPVSRGVSLMNVEDRYIPLVLYGAAVDAIRHMMMCLQFQQPQMVFGGPDGAKAAYGNLEGLKKNYEETWNAGIEQKKYGPYAGLTKTLVTPEFALPGGKSRWFRYLFSNNS